MSRNLALSLIIVALILGIGFGFLISPQYTSLNEDGEHTTDFGPGDRFYDLRFLNGMIIHHMAIKQLSEEYKSTYPNSEMFSVVEKISSEAQIWIDKMYAYRDKIYGDKSILTLTPEYTLNNLGTRDDKFHLRYINTVLNQTYEGDEMAEDAQNKSTRNESLETAEENLILNTNWRKSLEEWRVFYYDILTKNGATH